MRKKIPRADPGWRKKQAKTMKKRHGKNVYAIMGKKGGGPNSPGSFTSETARAASLKAWEVRRARQQQELEEQES